MEEQKKSDMIVERSIPGGDGDITFIKIHSELLGKDTWRSG